MPFLCALGIHAPIPSQLWNDGYYFSQCRRCHIDMIRSPAEKWRPVPPELRVVWKPRTPDDIVWPTHIT